MRLSSCTLATLLLAAPPAAAAEQCRGTTKRVFLVGERVSVFSVRDEHGIRRVCARRRDRPAVAPRYLDYAYRQGDFGASGARRFLVAGRWVAFTHCETSDRDDVSGCWPLRVDVFSGRGEELHPPGEQENDDVTDLALTRGGAVAWIQRLHAGTARVWLRDRRGVRKLDDSPAVEPRSLSLRGSVVRWRSAGTPRRARLR